MADRTTISISTDTKNELNLLGNKGEDYEDIIKRNINFTKKFNNEIEFHSWFKENFMLFGFDQIIKENARKFPDFVLAKDGNDVRVELETISSHFLAHKHNPLEVDLVICLVKDKEIPVKTVEISPFTYDGWSVAISCSQKQRKIFMAYKEVLSVLEQDKESESSDTPRKLSHSEVLDYLFSNSPLYETVKKYMEMKEKQLIELRNEFRKEVSK